jgi:predicted transcriptional regulator
MDIQSLKIELAQKILQTQNPELLFAINEIFDKASGSDWWDQLPKEIQTSIFEGLQDIEGGKVFTNDQVMKEAKEKYGF